MFETPIPKTKSMGFFQPFKQTPPVCKVCMQRKLLNYFSFHPIFNFQKFQEAI